MNDADALAAKGLAHYVKQGDGTFSKVKHPITEREPRSSRESDLHDAIEAYCRERGWLYIHSRMDRKTTQAKGVPDWIIFMAPNPGTYYPVLLIECKHPSNKQTKEQLAWAAHAKKMGHTVHVIHNLQEFEAVVA